MVRQKQLSEVSLRSLAKKKKSPDHILTETPLSFHFISSFENNIVCISMLLQVCREYQRGNCNRGENDCRFAHPADSAMIDTNDNTVTVCMDYIKGRCSREKCKYFHPPAHLQAKIKAAQYQVNQAAAAQAAATAAAMVSPQSIYMDILQKR